VDVYELTKLTRQNAMRVIGVRLRSLRASSGLSPREVARKVGVSESVVLSWEAGSTAPGVDQVASYIAAVACIINQELIEITMTL